MADRTGQVFGRYTLAQPVFTRDTVEVFEAIDNRLESRAVIWLLPIESDSDIERLNELARRLGKLEHESIAPLTDHGFQNDTAFLVTHYYPGGMLSGLLGQPHPYEDVAHLISPPARALEYLHGQGIVHGDIHPGNVYLDARGRLLLTGIGIAGLMQAEQDIPASCSSGLLNAAYLAPEQWQGSSTERSDIYALGVIFYELVTGRCPFDTDDPQKMLRQKMDESLTRPKNFTPGLPDAVQNIIFKMMAKDAENRYRDMAAFVEVIESLAHTKQVMKPVVSPDAETMAAEKETAPAAREYTAMTPMTPLQEDVKTTVSQQETELPDTMPGGVDAAPPERIRYSPTYAGAMAASPPPPPPSAAQPVYEAAPATKHRMSVGVLAAVAAFLFVCLLASAAGGYFWLTSDSKSEEKYIDSMIATGVSLTETAYVTPQSFDSSGKYLAVQAVPDDEKSPAGFLPGAGDAKQRDAGLRRTEMPAKD